MSVAVELDREKLTAVAKKRSIAYLALFGSVARGDATPESDVDLAIRFIHPVSLFDYVDAQLEMEQIFGYPVDLIPIDDVYPFVRDAMEADLIVLYEAPQDASLVRER